MIDDDGDEEEEKKSGFFGVKNAFFFSLPFLFFLSLFFSLFLPPHEKNQRERKRKTFRDSRSGCVLYAKKIETCLLGE